MQIKLGVLGVGAMASYMVKGLLANNDKSLDIRLSPRGAANAAALIRRFPGVRQMPTNQAVLDASDWILLAVRPQDLEEALKPLRFSDRHKVLSIVAMTRLARLEALTPQVKTFVRMVPLPFIERRGGPIVMYPGNTEILELFEGLGQIVVPQNEPSLDVLSAITGSMSPFYRIVGQVSAWGVQNGLDAETAAAYTIAFYSALLETCAQNPPAALGDLWREMTPGGLNARATEAIETGGGFALWNQALDEVIARIRRQGQE